MTTDNIFDECIKLCPDIKIKIDDPQQIIAGRINNVFVFDNGTKIIKINPDSNITQCEYDSMTYLAKININVPKIIDHGGNYLIYETIGVINSSLINKRVGLEHSEEDNTKILLYLNELHNIKNNMFGMDFNTTNGNIICSNNYTNNWVEFFIKNRWKPIFDNILKKNPKYTDLYIKSLRVIDIMPQIFNNEIIIPSLLHGDANPNNMIVYDNKVWFIDCSTFFGDPDYDNECFKCWTSKNDDWKTNPKSILYRASIMATVYYVTDNESRLESAIKLMNKLCEFYKPIYGSLVDKSFSDIKNKYKLVIIQSGSYNPIHLNHVANLDIAVDYAIKNSKLELTDILIVIAPASDKRINEKCDNGINLFDRINMCKIGLTNWIQKYQNQLGLILDYSLLDVNISDHYKIIYPDAEIVIVCGSDSLYWTEKYYPKNTIIWAIRRLGIPEKQLKKYYGNKNVILIDNQNEIKTSSTNIRNNHDMNRLDNDVAKYVKCLTL